MKQCGRLDLPQIFELPPLAKWKEKPPGNLYFGDPRSTQYFAPQTDATIFIGPEKGFSAKEESILQQTFHAKGVRLNPNILRAETAALCAISLINS
jgi:16S rRNA (uracil1498-N3)-methyltransferase